MNRTMDKHTKLALVALFAVLVFLACMSAVEANLTGAYLTGADLTEAYLTGAYLRRANLRGANLTGANLTGAIWDDNTRWPDGYEPPA